ncbi:MAG: LuxR C-terminal-related transcriptional regulator [Planctomycetaceae bacterium]|jgi:DNA-binding NarL/FixJ family response regulator|nr:LuxR C-terminal-related transcriptional regulator [Planctomycetaceae bacterium]
MSTIFRDIFPSLIIFEQRLMMGDMLRAFFQRHQLFERISVFKSPSEMELWEPSYHVPSLIFVSAGKPSFFEEICRYIRQQYYNSPILCLDKRVRIASLHIVVEHKVNGYWTLLDSTEDLLQGVIHAVKGIPTCCSAAKSFLEVEKNRFAIAQTSPESKFFKLSRRERELFTNIGRGLTLEDCSQQMSLTKKSVDNLKTRLMAKLDAHSITKIVYLAAKHGLTDY